MDPLDWVVLAIIDRSRGRRGEVLATSLSGGPDSFLERAVSMRRRSGGNREAASEPEPVTIEEAWLHDGRLVLKLAGVDSIEAAEALRGAELVVHPEARLPLGEGEYYMSDLVGFSLIDRHDGREIGPVTGWQESPGSILLTVQSGSREVLIPFVRAICSEIDTSGRRILADIPNGLLEL